MDNQHLIDTTKHDFSNDLFLNTFQRIYESSAGEFASAIDRISQQHCENLYWWVSLTASRSTIKSSLYKEFCLMKSIRHTSLLHGTKFSFIVSSAEIKKILNHSMGASCPEIIIKLNKGGLFEELKSKVRPYYFFLNKLLHLLLIKIKFSKLNYHSPITLAEVFLSPTENCDRYYPDLETFLDFETNKNIFFVPTIINTNPWSLARVLQQIEPHRKKYFFRELYLSLSDLKEAMQYQEKFLDMQNDKLQHNSLNQDKELEHLICSSLKNEPFNSMSAEGILNFKFLQNLREDKGVDILTFIDWWENTPMDRGLNLALNLFHPETKSKGYMGFVPNKYSFQLSPSQQERICKVVPASIGVIGEDFIPILKRYDQNINVFVAPAFRYRHLNNSHTKDQKYFLILPSIHPGESQEMIKIIIKIAVSFPSINFVIKSHPGAGKLSIFRNQIKLKNIRIESKSSANKLLQHAQILITSSPSAALEGIVRRIPAFVLNHTNLIPNNIIPDSISKKLWKAFDDAEDLEAAIKKFQDRQIGSNNQKDVIKISNYFNLPTQQNVDSFFK